jgi:cytochrome c oxidase subunit IV
MEITTGQQHPLGIYLKIWLLLFVLSTCSYLVDYFEMQGLVRWSLIVAFMLLKAGLIVSIFMHMAWERLALIYAILLPPLCLAVLIGVLTLEGDFTYDVRDVSMGQDTTLLAKSPVRH